MQYLWKCLSCGERVETSQPDHVAIRGQCCVLMHYVRDYRSEAVGIGAGVRVSRDGTLSEQAKLFLPDNSEFAGPGDPDGTKGMREWHDTHQRKETAGRGVKVGEIARRSF